MKWYVIQTKPRKEDEVSKRLGMANIVTLNPKIKSFNAGTKTLFPNYIFVKWDLSTPENHAIIKYTRGVNKVLGSPTCPVPISDEVMKVISERLGSDEVLEQQTMRIGSRVKVKKGLLKDLIAVLEKPISADGRVALLLKIHEREMRTVLDCKEVALVA